MRKSKSLIFEFLSRAKEMCHGIEGHMKWSHVYCKQLIGGRRGEELRQLSAHCKTLPIHISYSVLIIILLDLHEDTKHSSIMQQVRVTCNFCHYFSIFERLISDNTWNGWSFVKILFLSCPGAIKRMQNGLFSMHSKMPCCIIIFGKKSSIWIEGLGWAHLPFSKPQFFIQKIII